jgi:aminopeptidase N
MPPSHKGFAGWVCVGPSPPLSLRAVSVSPLSLLLAASLTGAPVLLGQASASAPSPPGSQATSGALLVPTNAERVAEDRDTRSHDFDLLHQRIEVGNFDWKSVSLDGRVATVLIARRSGLDSIVLDAAAGIAVARVVTPRGGALRTGRHGDTLVVHLPRPASFGDTVRFTVEYHAQIDNGRGLTFIEAEGRHRPQQIWSQGEAQDNHNWFPTYDFPNDKMTWEIVATVPRVYTVVSNGRLVSDVQTGGGLHTVHWSQDLPSATYLVSIVVAPLAHVADHWGKMPVDYYVYHDDSALARRAFGVTPDMIEVYSRLTGIAYPWAKYGQTTVADFFGGMENVSATTLVDWVPDSTAYHDRPWFQYILIPHELAHQWFGDYATTENWANTWLNEGFAEFMPGQYWQVKHGTYGAEDYYLDEYRQYMEIERQRSMPLASLGSNNIYPKGALVLEMLRHYLGSERFWAAIHYYLVHHAFGTAITEDVREAILQTSGENLTWFWEEWLYNAGLPAFTVAAAYDSAAQRLTLTVRQTQGDSARVDTLDGSGARFTIPTVFRMPVAIRVGTADSDIVTHADVSTREQTIAIDGVRRAPTMVVFDDGNGILKQLQFDQPTAWLVTQLRRDANLWDRSWVIAQLSARLTDSLAAAALADAAGHADYFLVRQEAVEALAEFPARWVAGAAEAAARDTSAAVRGAACATLAAVDTGAAAAPLRRLLQDPSYEVRAAALLALAKIDTADRSSLIVQGLSTPSYRDVIQDAALRAAVVLNDTAVIPAIDSLARTNRTSMIALAAFARRGNAHALALLNRALDDDQPATRRYALFAFDRGLPSSVALDALRERLNTLTHPDVRAHVQRLIDRLAKTAPAGQPPS